MLFAFPEGELNLSDPNSEAVADSHPGSPPELPADASMDHTSVDNAPTASSANDVSSPSASQPVEDKAASEIKAPKKEAPLDGDVSRAKTLSPGEDGPLP